MTGNVALSLCSSESVHRARQPLTHALTHTLSLLSLSLSISLTHTHSMSLYHSLFHTHTHTQTHVRCLFLWNSLPVKMLENFPLSLSLFSLAFTFSRCDHLNQCKVDNVKLQTLVPVSYRKVNT